MSRNINTIVPGTFTGGFGHRRGGWGREMSRNINTIVPGTFMLPKTKSAESGYVIATSGAPGRCSTFPPLGKHLPSGRKRVLSRLRLLRAEMQYTILDLERCVCTGVKLNGMDVNGINEKRAPGVFPGAHFVLSWKASRC